MINSHKSAITAVGLTRSIGLQSCAYQPFSPKRSRTAAFLSGECLLRAHSGRSCFSITAGQPNQPSTNWDSTKPPLATQPYRTNTAATIQKSTRLGEKNCLEPGHESVQLIFDTIRYQSHGQVAQLMSGVRRRLNRQACKVDLPTPATDPDRNYFSVSGMNLSTLPLMQ